MISRSEEVTILLKKLKAGHEWLMVHENDPVGVEGLLNRAGPIVDKLGKFGISRQALVELLLFGKEIQND